MTELRLSAPKARERGAKRKIKEAGDEQRRADRIREKVAKDESYEEFEAGYYSTNARTGRARKLLMAFAKHEMRREWSQTYESAYKVLLAIAREWRKKGAPEEGVAINPVRLCKITGFAERRNRELVTLLKAEPLRKNGKLYPVPLSDDGEPFLAVTPGKGRAVNRYLPHLP